MRAHDHQIDRDDESQGSAFSQFCAKQLERESKRCEKEHNVNKTKIKEALQQGNVDGARVYSENAIRKRSESLNYLRMAARVDDVVPRIKTAMKQVPKYMGHIVKGLDKAMASMDLQKIEDIMDKFETLTECPHCQIVAGFNAMDQRVDDAALSSPSDQAEALIQQVADEFGLEIANMLSDAAAPTDSIGVASTSVSNQQEDALSRRLEQLRNL